MAWCLALVGACDDGGPPRPDDGIGTDAASGSFDVGARDAAGPDTPSDVEDGAGLRLLETRPVVRIDGVWRAEPAEGRLGMERVQRERTALQPFFRPGQAVTIEGVGVEGAFAGAGALTGWVSNGFQSWSQSGVLALRDVEYDVPTMDQTLRRTGDAEVTRTGDELSWWFTVVGGPDSDAVVLLGAIESRRRAPWVQVWRDGDHLRFRLGQGGGGRTRELAPDETWSGEPWVAWAGPPDEVMARYGDALAARRAGARAEAGWNSWYELWDGVDEQAVRENAALVGEHLAPGVPDEALPLRIVVDDGWQRGWGDWFPNEKFPSGLDGLAADLRADGFRVGVWLAPLLVGAGDALVAEHPDWFVPDAVFPHLKNGPMRVLDATHPDAAAHLAGFTRRIVGWGYDLLKIDFLFAGTAPGPRHDGSTPTEAYVESLRVIREAAGADTLLLAVGAPPLTSLPYVDAWRVGGDIAVENLGVVWPFLPNQLRSIAARYPICLATLCDADPVILRELAPGEVDLGAWVVATSGGALFWSDDLRLLPADRMGRGLDDGRAALSSGGIPSRPLDLFPAAPPPTLRTALADHLSGDDTHVVPSRWALPDGRTLHFDLSARSAEAR